VGDLIDHLGRQSPELTPRLSSVLPVIAGRHVDPTEPLAHQSEVSLLLPVSGGSIEDAMAIQDQTCDAADVGCVAP
jgi:hypothetical protein